MRSPPILRRFGDVAFAVAVAAAAATLNGCGDGDPIAAQRGQWLFINYWAIWCKPCIHEVPELNALHARPGFTVLGVNYDGETGPALQEQLDKLDITFPTLDADPAERYGVERPQVLPTTLVIDPSGALREVLIGPQTAETLIAATGQAAPAI